MSKNRHSLLHDLTATAAKLELQSKGKQDLLIARAAYRQMEPAELERILDPRELLVTSLRLGQSDSGTSYTLPAVGETLGVSKERVRQLQGTAARKLKEYGVARQLAREIIATLGHETRRRILHSAIKEDPAPISPSKVSRGLAVPLGQCSNHFKVLSNADFMFEKEIVQNRGRAEHLYSLRYESLFHPIAQTIMVAFMDPVGAGASPLGHRQGESPISSPRIDGNG